MKNIENIFNKILVNLKNVLIEFGNDIKILEISDKIWKKVRVN